ncbi:hypothetical protein BKA65DRAFT_487858 [Rhexocercosporidium sp. MPI-PUGE-AT-0058]|nr:hypothetical protein BKA65DRAFT_487858 [Rhexocercosporidium sp. MPI-PUGE-AT-0058]
MAGNQDEQSSLTLVSVKENENEVPGLQGKETSSAIFPQAKLPNEAFIGGDGVSSKDLRSFTDAASDSAQGNKEWWWTAGVFGRETNYGCSCSMSTFRPKVRPGDYSRLTTFVANDDNSHPEQSIQAGWIRGVSGEDSDLCQVFVYFSTAGSTGASANNVQGWNDEVTGWVQATGAFRPGHDVILASRIDGLQGSLDLKIQLTGDRWNLRMNGNVIGYYPTSLFAVNAPDQKETLADHATRVGFFGQVYDASSDGMTPTRMGSGKYPDEGFGKSAYISKVQYQPSPSNKNATMSDADASWLQINDDPMRYECRVSWKSTSWWRSYMYLGGPGCDDIGWSSWESAGGIFGPGTPVTSISDPGTPVTSISRNSAVIDLFVVGKDGKVYNSFWWNENWSAFNDNWRKLDWGGNEKFLVGSRIAAVARSPGNLDIFVIGEDFKIYTAWWSEGHDWSGYRNISGDNVFPNPQVAAISRKLGQLDVFVLSGGVVSYSHWSQLGPNSVIDWTGIHQAWDSLGAVPSTLGSFLGTGVVNMQVVSRSPETMQFFISGADTDGSAAVLWNTWSVGPSTTYGTWSSFGSIGQPSSLFAGSRVAAVARGPDRIDVFVINIDFFVYTSHWDKSSDTWSGTEDKWKKIGPKHLLVNPIQYFNVISVSRKPSCMDLFATTLDGEVYTASIDESLRDAKWSKWQALGGKGFINLPSTLDLGFCAVSRNHQTLAVIGCGLNSKLWVTEWLDPACGPRPFYCMAHNPDTMNTDPAKDDATLCLQKGANCLGPDVNRSEESGKLVISHGGKAGNNLGHDTDPDLVSYLQHLRTLAETNPQFSLIAFDCKEQAYLPKNGPDGGGDFGNDVLTAIRNNLTKFVPITIVISVAQLTGSETQMA